tara:strand:+ start:237 stop:488 length:252 start_codon:yes stop_codon:yes gene_type:complete
MNFREYLETESINESAKQMFKKLLDRIGWSGVGLTPEELTKQVSDLDDETLKLWHSTIGFQIPHTPAKLQKDLVAREIKKRKL